MASVPTTMKEHYALTIAAYDKCMGHYRSAVYSIQSAIQETSVDFSTEGLEIDHHELQHSVMTDFYAAAEDLQKSRLLLHTNVTIRDDEEVEYVEYCDEEGCLVASDNATLAERYHIDHGLSIYEAERAALQCESETYWRPDFVLAFIGEHTADHPFLRYMD